MDIIISGKKKQNILTIKNIYSIVLFESESESKKSEIPGLGLIYWI